MVSPGGCCNKLSSRVLRGLLLFPLLPAGATRSPYSVQGTGHPALPATPFSLGAARYRPTADGQSTSRLAWPVQCGEARPVPLRAPARQRASVPVRRGQERNRRLIHEDRSASCLARRSRSRPRRNGACSAAGARAPPAGKTAWRHPAAGIRRPPAGGGGILPRGSAGLVPAELPSFPSGEHEKSLR